MGNKIVRIKALKELNLGYGSPLLKGATLEVEISSYSTKPDSTEITKAFAQKVGKQFTGGAHSLREGSDYEIID